MSIYMHVHACEIVFLNSLQYIHVCILHFAFCIFLNKIKGIFHGPFKEQEKNPKL